MCACGCNEGSEPHGSMAGDDTGVAAGGLFPRPWPPHNWRCLRWTGISGRYSGSLDLTTILRSERLDLRLDIDTRYSTNSPVMNKVSGDQFVRNFRPFPPGFGPEVYSHSWIVDAPVVSWTRCSATITGDVRYFSGSRPPTTIQIVVSWSLGGPTTATVTFGGGVTGTYSGMTFISDSFRSIELEMDYCTSANVAPLAPGYGTLQHSNHPADISNRTLTIDSVYREAGVSLNYSAGSSVVDDSAPGFATWNVSELHDAMETGFSRYASGWPNWRLWGLQVGSFDSSSLGGIMFDAPAANGGAGDRPDRQGFAVARNHSWFSDLVASPSTQSEYDAMRKYLYVWVHEAGHAWNLLHSWNKSRPSSLSWMNYDWKYDAINGADTFWNRFYMRFDDDELIHMRHGDRKTVIMGGDDWGTGGHLEAPPSAALEAGPDQPVELMVRCKPYMLLMEPVSVELRLRNTTPVPIPIDPRLDPRHGMTTVVISRPDGTWIDFTSVMCLLGEPQELILSPAAADAGAEGPDRYSEQVPLTFGSSGFVFDQPGTYRIKAAYSDGRVTSVSNVASLRIGIPATREEDRLAADWFSNAVGLTVALGGSMSPHLDAGLDTLRDAAERFAGNDVGISAAQVLAAGVGDDFYRRQGDAVVRSHEADPDAALALTDPALQAHRSAGDKTTNLAYRTLVEQRVELHIAAGRPAQARKELTTLATALVKRGANPNVVADVRAEGDRVAT